MDKAIDIMLVICCAINCLYNLYKNNIDIAILFMFMASLYIDRVHQD